MLIYGKLFRIESTIGPKMKLFISFRGYLKDSDFSYKIYLNLNEDKPLAWMEWNDEKSKSYLNIREYSDFYRLRR